jgi:hypothetical protein
MIEIRTADSSKIDTLLGLLEEFGVKIGLGSECCVHKLPTLEQVKTAASRLDDLTVITPITPQKHFDWIMEYINGLPATVRLVVNDVGVLYSLHENGMLERFCPVIAGRGIVHTSEACPWVDHLLRDETELIKQAFLQTNLNYSRTLNFFKGLGISGMETDMAPRTVKAAVSTGLPVAAHAEYIAVSYARSCHTARFYNEQPPECTQRCNSPIELELVDMFDLSGIPPGFAQPSQEMLDIFPPLYLLGNTLFMKSDCHDTRELERVIINSDMYDSMGLKNTILSFISLSTGKP